MGGSRLAISAATRFISAKRVRSAKYTEWAAPGPLLRSRARVAFARDLSRATKTAEVDSDQGRDVGDRKAVARNVVMSVQFVIHSFEALVNNRSLRLSIFWKLHNTPLKDRVSILKRARDWTKQFQFHPAIPPLDLRL